MFGVGAIHRALVSCPTGPAQGRLGGEREEDWTGVDRERGARRVRPSVCVQSLHGLPGMRLAASFFFVFVVAILEVCTSVVAVRTVVAV